MVTSGYGPRTAWHVCILMVWLNNSQESMSTGPMRDPHGRRTALLRTRKKMDSIVIGKNPVWASYLALKGPVRTPLRSPHGLFTGCLQSLKPYEARKLITHVLKLYGPRRGGGGGGGGGAKFVPRRTGPVGAPWVDVRFLFKTAPTEPNSREQPLRGPGVWCDWGISYSVMLGRFYISIASGLVLKCVTA